MEPLPPIENQDLSLALEEDLGDLDLMNTLQIISDIKNERERKISLMGLLSSLMPRDPIEIQDQCHLILENSLAKPTYAEVLRRGL